MHQKLTSSRKVGHVLFNPAAENILASSSGDYTIKLWDLEDGQAKLTLKHNDIVQSLSWSANGSMLVTTSRDKKLRFWDVRQQKPAHEVAGHAGAKNSRCVWLGDHDRVATTGFSKMSERQLGLWDVRNPTKPVGGDFNFLDSSSGVGMPFWDDGCQILYIAGKGDGNIRYYEYESDKLEYLSEYKSPEPQRGLAFVPKRGVNTHENEVMRAYKTVNDAYIEPISFIVPRRSENFQEDIYPPAVGTTPAVSSADWLGGKDGLPPKWSMEDIFDGKQPTEMAASEAPRPTTARSAPAPTPAPAPEPVKAPVIEAPDPTPSAPIAREPPNAADNKASMSAMASRFADKHAEEEDDDDSSSFEEVEKPIQRPTARTAEGQEAKVGVSTAEPQTTTLEPSLTQTSPPPPAASQAASAMSEPEPEPPSTTAASTATGGLRDVLQEIRSLLQSQGKQIEHLTSEVAQLKSKVG